MCYMNIHEHTRTALRCRLNSADKSFTPEYWHHALASPHVWCRARKITEGSPLWRDLTKVISNLYYRSWNWHVPARNRTQTSRGWGEHSSKELLEQPIINYLEHLDEPLQYFIYLVKQPFAWQVLLSLSYVPSFQNSLQHSEDLTIWKNVLQIGLTQVDISKHNVSFRRYWAEFK